MIFLLLLILFSFIGAMFLFKKFLNYFFAESNEPVFLDLENRYLDPSRNNKPVFFPSLKDSPEVTLTLVFPAYNEEERLEGTLIDTIKFLKNKQELDKSFKWEIIVVDDGSKDRTSQLALGYSKKEGVDLVRVLTLKKNRGKGGAVKRGMLCSRGKYILMVDADGATEISDLNRLEDAVKKVEKNGLGLGIGSRAHLVQEALAKRTFFRNCLMYGFHLLVNLFGIRGVQDTQCGFKLFTRKAAELIFFNIHLERWAFDLEVIYLANYFNIPFKEVSVNWTEVPGSKLSPFEASLQMGKDLLKLRLAYLFQIWTVTHK